VLVNSDFAALPGIVERSRPQDTDATPYGDGHAAEAAVAALLSAPRPR
jgi:UDP-N-acetylglucosamine 2-epimerase (non-hydrolysing)